MERELNDGMQDQEQDDGQFLSLPDGAQNRKLSLLMQH